MNVPRKVNVLDMDFFVTRLGDPGDCSELIGASLLSRMRILETTRRFRVLITLIIAVLL